MKINFIYFLLSLATLSCSQFPNLGPEFRVDYNGRGDIQLMDGNNSVLIDGHILDLNHDSSFILVKQKPRDSVRACSDLTSTVRECDRAFEKSNLELYWIVDKRTGALNGPFTLEQYRLKRRELRVSENLSLEGSF